MTIAPEKYIRKPFTIEAVRVSQSNMEEAAKWCGGSIKLVQPNMTRYIYVNVSRPLKENQTRAFIGDWVLLAGKGWKVYTNRAFEACFEKAEKTDREFWQSQQEPLFEAPKDPYSGLGSGY